MPFLVDGNNLMHAMQAVGPEVGRDGLCKFLGHLVRHGERVCVVFDGPPPPGPMARRVAAHNAEVLYAAPRTADEVIEERIQSDSAPRRLVVVSSDRHIRKAARRRRCQGRRSEPFARALLTVAESDRCAPVELEPAEKQTGLGPEQTQQWLREFGLMEEP